MNLQNRKPLVIKKCNLMHNIRACLYSIHKYSIDCHQSQIQFHIIGLRIIMISLILIIRIFR